MKAQLSLFTSEVSTSSLFSPLDAFISELAEAIAEGRWDATLIPWSDCDAAGAIEAAGDALMSLGWVWVASAEQFERDGWYIWFRSQGKLSAPIAQWARIMGARDPRNDWPSAWENEDDEEDDGLLFVAIAEAARRRDSVAVCGDCGHKEKEHDSTGTERGCYWSTGNGRAYQDCSCNAFRLA